MLKPRRVVNSKGAVSFLGDTQKRFGASRPVRTPPNDNDDNKAWTGRLAPYRFSLCRKNSAESEALFCHTHDFRERCELHSGGYRRCLVCGAFGESRDLVCSMAHKPVLRSSVITVYAGPMVSDAERRLITETCGQKVAGSQTGHNSVRILCRHTRDKSSTIFRELHQHRARISEPNTRIIQIQGLLF